MRNFPLILLAMLPAVGLSSPVRDTSIHNPSPLRSIASRLWWDLTLPDPADSIWKKSDKLPLVVLHTGRPAFDDALAAGLKQYWHHGPWKWIDDTALDHYHSQTPYIALSLTPVVWALPRMAFDGTCPGKSQAAEFNCVFTDSARFLVLTLVPPDGRTRILYSQITQIPAYPGAFGMALDLVKDVVDVLSLQWGTSELEVGMLPQDSDWQLQALFDLRRNTCKSCTLYVPREFGFDTNTQELSKAVGHPVRVLGLDSLDGLLGTQTEGLYLESGNRSVNWKSGRIRSLKTGQIRASLNFPLAFSGARSDTDRTLNLQNLSDLGHQLRGDEYRPVYGFGWDFRNAVGTNSSLFWISIEMRRHILGMAAIGSNSGQGFSNLEWGIGARWLPTLRYGAFGWAVFPYLDLWVLVPSGGGQVRRWGELRWNAPVILGTSANLHLAFFDLGIGLAAPSSKPFSGSKRVSDLGILSLNFGVSLMLRDWRSSHPSLWRRAPAD